jgi:hypothetical protein
MGWIDLPSGGTFLAFDYYFEQANSEDYVVLYIDDIPIWMLNEEFSLLEDGMQTELIPVSAAPGRRKFTVALFGDAALGSVFYLDGLRVGAPVPEASTCTLLAVGLGLLGFLVRRGRGSFAG